MVTTQRHEHGAMPEQVGDEQLGDLLAAIGNHENKALLSAAMIPNKIYSRHDLEVLFNGMQGEEPVWRVDSGLPFGYCLHSLAPIGLVTKELIDAESGRVGFIKTEYGAGVGDALAGHLLRYSLEHPDISLQQLFGRTSTNSAEGTRSPFGRIAIFGELLTRELPVRVSDLEASHGGSGTGSISDHLRNLAKNKIIELENRSSSDPIMEYGLGAEPLADLPLRPYQSSLPSDIREILSELLVTKGLDATITTHKILEIIRDRSEYLDSDQDKLMRRINQTMRFFVESGMAKKVGSFTQTDRSVIRMSGQQAHVMNDCMELIYKFQEGSPDFLEVGREQARVISSDTNAVATLIAKARQVSPYANRKSDEERAALIKSVLANNPSATVKDIEENIANSHILISPYSVRRSLRELEAKQIVARGLKSKKVVWSLVEN